MSLGMNEHPAQRNRRRGMAQFVQRITVQEIEPLAAFHYHQFARCRNTEQPAVHPHGRSKVVPADAFLIVDGTGRRVETGYDAAVAPEPDQTVRRNARRDVGRRFLNLVGLFRIPPSARPPGVDCRDKTSAAATSTRAENNVPGNDG